MNTITVVGNIGKEVETRTTKTGKNVALFSVADNKKMPDGSFAAQWWHCVAWNELAEAAVQELRSGDRVEVTGKVNQRRYTAKDGTERTAYEVVVYRIGKVVKPIKQDGGGFDSMGHDARDEEVPF